MPNTESSSVKKANFPPSFDYKQIGQAGVGHLADVIFIPALYLRTMLNSRSVIYDTAISLLP
jgi:hypothetical protein